MDGETVNRRGLNNRIPPPLVFATFAGAMAIFAWLLPSYGTLSWADRAIGTAFFLLAGLSGPPAVLRFIRAKTTINPVTIEQASVLVTDGVYRWTRNPMYLSMTALLSAIAAFSTQPWLWIGPILFVVFIHHFQIRPEENAMRSLFGEEYEAYTQRVRRWL